MTITAGTILGEPYMVSEEDAIQLYQSFSNPAVIQFLERTIESNALALLGQKLTNMEEKDKIEFLLVVARAQGLVELATQCLNISINGKELYGRGPSG